MADSNNFINSVETTQPKRSAFNLGHSNRMSAELGKLYPFFCQPAVPGDKFEVNAEAYVRLAPMLSPMFGEFEVEITHYFVPNRLLWKNWQKFITGGVDGQQNPSFPRFRLNKDNCSLFGTGSLADYLGYNLPCDKIHQVQPQANGRPQYCDTANRWTANLKSGYRIYQDISSLPFRAYQLIVDTYWSDENIDTHLAGEIADETYQTYFLNGGVVVPSGSTITDEASYNAALTRLRTACYRKDYFTASLPWTQRGGAVTLPLTGNADVYMHTNSTPQISRQSIEGGVEDISSALTVERSAVGRGTPTLNNDPTSQWEINLNGTHFADLSSVNSATINDLRQAFALQRWLERNAIGGCRYIEQILMHFGVRDKDARLQRPEYITGAIGTIHVAESLQTSQSTDASSTPQGNPVGVGNIYLKDNSYSYTADEHGYFMSLLVIRPRASYYQGISRDWFKFDRMEFLWPEFAHLGEQAVYSQELLNTIQNFEEDGFETFGYMPRYSEYRFINDQIHADFKDSLFHWQLGRTIVPNLTDELSPEFLHVDPSDANQVWNVTDAAVDKFWCDIRINCKAIRPLPLYATPQLIG